MDNLISAAVIALVRSLSLLVTLMGVVLAAEILQGTSSVSDSIAGAVSVGGLALVIALGLWHLAPNLVKARASGSM